MYAIVEIAGQQFKVAKDQKLYVNRLQGEQGSSVTFDKVMLLSNGESVAVGTPAIAGASVTAKVLGHLKGDKVIVFKKKRRKGYKKKNGHRQYLSEIQIENILTSKVAKQKEAPKKQAVKPAVKKEVPKKIASKKADDLKKIEGIGPKIATIFNEAGIVTFSDLAQTPVTKLKEILVAAGSRYASKNPSSWSKQAKMAAEGKWEELSEWQKNVKGGIE